ncbi:LRR receptor-like serine threonine- kinase GSO1, partial [Olea europaea subsp. europaea]
MKAAIREILIFVIVHYPTIVIAPNQHVLLSTDDESEKHGFMDMDFFYISFIISYLSVVLRNATVLFINPHWRKAWLHFIE